MGRSVSSPRNAWVTYAATPTEEDWEVCDTCGDRKDDGCECDHDETSFSTIYGETDREYIRDDLKTRAKALMPSLWDNNEWLGREDQVLLSNNFCHFGFSEYCGLMAIWLVVKDRCDKPHLAEKWAEKVWPKFKAEFGEYDRLGGLSDGTSAYRRIGQ